MYEWEAFGGRWAAILPSPCDSCPQDEGGTSRRPSLENRRERETNCSFGMFRYLSQEIFSLSCFLLFAELKGQPWWGRRGKVRKTGHNGLQFRKHQFRGQSPDSSPCSWVYNNKNDRNSKNSLHSLRFAMHQAPFLALSAGHLTEISQLYDKGNQKTWNLLLLPPFTDRWLCTHHLIS